MSIAPVRSSRPARPSCNSSPPPSEVGLEQRLELRGIPYWQEEHYGSRSIYVTDPNGTVFEATPAVEMPASGGPDSSAHERIRRWSAP